MKLRKIKINKKGDLSSFNIFYFMIVSFLFVVFAGGLIYIMGILNDVFMEVGRNNEANAGQPLYTNMTLAAEQIWGEAYDSIQALRIVSAVYILALAASIVIVGFLERKYPFLFFAYVLIILLGVLFAPTISNAYEELLNSNIYENELQNFTAANFLILNLPVFVLIIGALGGIGLFINLIRGSNEQNLY